MITSNNTHIELSDFRTQQRPFEILRIFLETERQIEFGDIKKVNVINSSHQHSCNILISNIEFRNASEVQNSLLD
jgi:hypothetical protein